MAGAIDNTIRNEHDGEEDGTGTDDVQVGDPYIHDLSVLSEAEHDEYEFRA